MLYSHKTLHFLTHNYLVSPFIYPIPNSSSTSKCKVMNIGTCNPHTEYAMTPEEIGSKLAPSHEEKDCGVTIDRKLKFDKYHEMQVNKANKILNMINRSVT